MDTGTRAEELVRAMVESEGFELVHVAFVDQGASSVLRIYIDKPGGITLADCQKVSRSVSVLLDVEDPIAHRYTLEVSSPGLDRPLFSAADYERFAGREIKVVSLEKLDDRRKFTGLLLGISGGVIRLDCDGEEVRVPLELIKKANLVYRFD